MRIDDLIGPLFDMWHRFEAAFADRAIDRLDLSDADAELAAVRMQSIGTSGAAFAHLLRHISIRRSMREWNHKVSAVWAAGGPESLSFREVQERYDKLPKGDA